jgi:hypothetical protein
MQWNAMGAENPDSGDQRSATLGRFGHPHNITGQPANGHADRRHGLKSAVSIAAGGVSAGMAPDPSPKPPSSAHGDAP